jgi:hypothetical protein
MNHVAALDAPPVVPAPEAPWREMYGSEVLPSVDGVGVCAKAIDDGIASVAMKSESGFICCSRIKKLVRPYF